MIDLDYKTLCSVLCCSYNHENFIKDCIYSIWNQSYKNVEIIALDDGSKDKSVTVLQDLCKDSSLPMQIIVQENTGNLAKNLNKMIRMAKGKYVVFISCDDFLTENSISEKIALMKQDESLCFVTSRKYYKINEDATILKEMDQVGLNAYTTVNDLLNLEYERFHSFFIQGAVFRKDLINNIDGFNENMTGDDIVLRTKVFFHLKNNSYKTFMILDTFGFYYRIHSDNIHKNIIRQIKTVVEILDTFFVDKPSPEILIRWMRYCVRSIGLKEANVIFTFSDRCVKLKSDVLKMYCIGRLFAIWKILIKSSKLYHIIKKYLNLI